MSLVILTQETNGFRLNERAYPVNEYEWVENGEGCILIRTTRSQFVLLPATRYEDFRNSVGDAYSTRQSLQNALSAALYRAPTGGGGGGGNPAAISAAQQRADQAFDRATNNRDDIATNTGAIATINATLSNLPTGTPNNGSAVFTLFQEVSLPTDGTRAVSPFAPTGLSYDEDTGVVTSTPPNGWSSIQPSSNPTTHQLFIIIGNVNPAGTVRLGSAIAIIGRQGQDGAAGQMGAKGDKGDPVATVWSSTTPYVVGNIVIILATGNLPDRLYVCQQAHSNQNPVLINSVNSSANPTFSPYENQYWYCITENNYVYDNAQTLRQGAIILVRTAVNGGYYVVQRDFTVSIDTNNPTAPASADALRILTTNDLPQIETHLWTDGTAIAEDDIIIVEGTNAGVFKANIAIAASVNRTSDPTGTQATRVANNATGSGSTTPSSGGFRTLRALGSASSDTFALSTSNPDYRTFFKMTVFVEQGSRILSIDILIADLTINRAFSLASDENEDGPTRLDWTIADHTLASSSPTRSNAPMIVGVTVFNIGQQGTAGAAGAAGNDGSNGSALTRVYLEDVASQIPTLDETGITGNSETGVLTGLRSGVTQALPADTATSDRSIWQFPVTISSAGDINIGTASRAYAFFRTVTIYRTATTLARAFEADNIPSTRLTKATNAIANLDIQWSTSIPAIPAGDRLFGDNITFHSDGSKTNSGVYPITGAHGDSPTAPTEYEVRFGFISIARTDSFTPTAAQINAFTQRMLAEDRSERFSLGAIDSSTRGGFIVIATKRGVFSLADIHGSGIDLAQFRVITSTITGYTQVLVLNQYINTNNLSGKNIELEIT